MSTNINWKDKFLDLKEKHLIIEQENCVIKQKHLIIEQENCVIKQKHLIIEQENRVLKQKHLIIEQENHVLKQRLDDLDDIVNILKTKGIIKYAKQDRTKKDSPGKNKPKRDHTKTAKTRPQHVDETKEIDDPNCRNCGNHLSEIVDRYERIVEDVIPARKITKRLIINRRFCKKCNKTVSPIVSDALPNQRFGVNLMVLATSLHIMGISYDKISNHLHIFFEIDVSPSALNKMIFRVAQEFGPVYTQMKIDLLKEKNIHGDETSWPLGGKNHWLWVFVGEYTTLYEVSKSRGRTVPQDVLGAFTGNVTSDSWPAWNYAGRTHQRCLIHYMRRIDETVQYHAPSKEFIHFGNTLKKILHDSRGKCKKKNLLSRIDRLIRRKYSDLYCKKFCKTLRRERDMLFTFLDTGTDYHNNTAERAIRPCVILRKMTYGSRSGAGADALKKIMSVRETCKLRNVNFHDYALGILSRITSKS